jgi:transposase
MKSSVRFAQPIDCSSQPIGRPKVITDEYLDSLKRLTENSPQVYGYPFKRWTAAWLRRHLAKEFGIEVSDRHINRLLQQMGLSTRTGSARKNDSDSGHYRIGNILIQDLNPDAVPEFDWPVN